MTTPRQRLMMTLHNLGVEAELHEHDAVFTVAESHALHARIPGAHTKNLFVKNKKGQMALVTAEAHAEIDLKALGQALGFGRISFASAERLREHLAVEPGSVTPLAVLNDEAGAVTLALHRSLEGAETVNVHPMENSATLGLSLDDLLRFARHTGHEPVWVDA